MALGGLVETKYYGNFVISETFNSALYMMTDEVRRLISILANRAQIVTPTNNLAGTNIRTSIRTDGK